MADAPLLIAPAGSHSVPFAYTIPGSQELAPVSVYAQFDGSAASGPFLACLSFYAQSGERLSRVYPAQEMQVGDVARVTYAPFQIADDTDTPASSASEIFLTAAGIWPSVTSGASLPNRQETATNKQDVYVVAFADAVTSYAQASIVMPSNWDAGTFTATFYWMVNSAAAGSVVWGVQGRAYGHSDNLDQAWGTAVTVTAAGVSTAFDVLVSAATAAVTFAGTPAAGNYVLFRVYREGGAAGDTLAATAQLLGVLINYGTV